MATKEAKIRITAQDKTRAAVMSARKNLMGLKSAAAGVSSALTGLAPAASIVGITAMAKSAIDLGSRLDDTAKKLGVTTGFLQEFGFAARETGVKTQAAEMGLQRFTRRLAEAQMGKGELLPVLQQYNIALTDSEGRARSAEEVLREYADTIKNALTPQEQLRLAFKAFDSEGAGLVTVLKNGAAGLDEWSKAARNAGQVMSDETIKTLAEAENRLERMTTRMTIWAGTLVKIGSIIGQAAKKVPEIPGASVLGLLDMETGLTKNDKPGEGAGGTPPPNPFKFIADPSLASKIKNLNQSLAQTSVGVLQVSVAATDLSSGLESVAFEGFQNVEYKAKDAMEKTSTWMDDAAGAVTGMAYALEDGLVNAAKNGKAAFGDMAQFILAEIQRILIRSLVLRPLFGFIGGMIGNNPVGNAFSNSFGGGKAGGGMVGAGRSYMVGERGPEMVTMGSNGYITPNDKLGGGPVFNVDMRGASVEAVARLEQFVGKLNGSIERRALAAVGDARSRQPAFLMR